MSYTWYYCCVCVLQLLDVAVCRGKPRKLFSSYLIPSMLPRKSLRVRSRGSLVAFLVTRCERLVLV